MKILALILVCFDSVRFPVRRALYGQQASRVHMYIHAVAHQTEKSTLYADMWHNFRYLCFIATRHYITNRINKNEEIKPFSCPYHLIYTSSARGLAQPPMLGGAWRIIVSTFLDKADPWLIPRGSFAFPWQCNNNIHSRKPWPSLTNTKKVSREKKFYSPAIPYQLALENKSGPMQAACM